MNASKNTINKNRFKEFSKSLREKKKKDKELDIERKNKFKK